ncbi:MAG: DUF433 domain-containing protein [Pirellulaceae bacterium]
MITPNLVAYVHGTDEGGWRIAGTRISLDSVVRAYWDGKSPEEITEAFPTLSVEQVFGAIAFYLRHRNEIDAHLQQQEHRWADVQVNSAEANGPLLARLRAARDAHTDEPQS